MYMYIIYTYVRTYVYIYIYINHLIYSHPITAIGTVIKLEKSLYCCCHANAYSFATWKYTCLRENDVTHSHSIYKHKM